MGNPKRGTFPNNEDQDEIQPNGSTLFVKVKKIFRQQIQFFFIKYKPTLYHRYVQWTILSLLYQTRRKNPLVYEGLNLNN